MKGLLKKLLQFNLLFAISSFWHFLLKQHHSKNFRYLRSGNEKKFYTQCLENRLYPKVAVKVKIKIEELIDTHYELDFVFEKGFFVKRSFAIEIDGEQHNNPENILHDKQRDIAVFIQTGIPTFRIPSDRLKNVPIKDNLDEFTKTMDLVELMYNRL